MIPLGCEKPIFFYILNIIQCYIKVYDEYCVSAALNLNTRYFYIENKQKMYAPVGYYLFEKKVELVHLLYLTKNILYFIPSK